MNWFTRTLRAIERRASSWWSNQPSWGGLVAGQGTPSGIHIDPESALGLTAYYAAINRIATDIAGLPLKVYRKRPDGGREELTDHPVAPLLSVSPDGETTAMRWRQSIAGHMLGWGNGYAEIQFTGGIPSGLFLLDPSTTNPQRRPEDRKLYYRVAGGTLAPFRVLHFAGFGFDGLQGYSPAHIHRDAIGLALAAEQFGGAFFGNGSRPAGVLELPYKLKDVAAVEQLKKGWHTEYGGASNAGKVAVLEQGAKFTATSIPPDDAQFLQTRQFQVLEIARMFGIPPHQIGDYSSTGGAYRALEEANLDYLRKTIVPWCEAIEQTLNWRLLTEYERSTGIYIEHNVEGFLRGDSRARGEFYKTLMGMSVLTPNDIARRENLQPIGPDGDRRYMSVQFQPLDQVEDATEPLDDPTDEPTDPEDDLASLFRSRFALPVPASPDDRGGEFVQDPQTGRLMGSKPGERLADDPDPAGEIAKSAPPTADKGEVKAWEKEARTEHREMVAEQKTERRDMERGHASELKDQAKEHAGEVKDLAKQQAGEVKDQAKEHAGEVKDQASEQDSELKAAQSADPESVPDVQTTHEIDRADLARSHDDDRKALADTHATEQADLANEHADARRDLQAQHAADLQDLDEFHHEVRREWVENKINDFNDTFDADARSARRTQVAAMNGNGNGNGRHHP
jgi:HK97 family phage portal protein